MIKKIFFLITLSFALSACGTKTKITPTPTPAPKLVEIPAESRPSISLIPRDDGHMLFLKISDISSDINSIEYEVIYTATDGKIEVEKGVGDTIKEISNTLERKLLLGTESCTNGCKYKYDEGVNGGTLTASFTSKTGQMYRFETPFSLNNSSQINKAGDISLKTENYSVKPKTKLTGNDFFVLMKNYKGGYSIFSNGSQSLVGNYQ